VLIPTLAVLAATTIASGGGPAASPWPVAYHDAQLSGRSAVPGVSDPSVLWEAVGDLPGDDYSYGSASIGADGAIYLWANEVSGSTAVGSAILALEPDGSRRWRYELGVGHGVGGVALASDGAVIFATDQGKLWALNADGTQRWQVPLGCGGGANPITLGSDGTIYAIDPCGLFAYRDDGTLMWQASVPAGWTSPPALSSDGLHVYVVGNDATPTGLVSALDAATGDVEWQYAMSELSPSGGGTGPGLAVSPFDGAIYVAADERSADPFTTAVGHVYALEPDGTLRWTYTLPSGQQGGLPAIGVDGTAHVKYGSWTSMYVVALRPDGSTAWTSQELYGCGRCGPFGGGSPTIAGDDSVYVTGGQSGRLYALNGDGTTRWELPFLGRVSMSVALGATGTIYVGTSGQRPSSVFAIGPPTLDGDGDGIADAVDLAPTVPSSAFDDGDGNYGQIASIPPGFTVEVADALTPGGGLQFEITGTGTQKVQVLMCGFTNPWRLPAGFVGELGCGSVIVTVTTGTAEYGSAGDLVTVTASAGTTVEVSEHPDGSVTVDTLSGPPVSVVVDGVPTSVADNDPPLTGSAVDFQGFSQPVDNSSPPATIVLNEAKAGQAIPFKWRLLKADGTPMTTLSSASISSQAVACGMASSTDPLETTAATGGGLQNLGDGYYQLNHKSDKAWANSCRILRLKLGNDTVTHDAYFRFKK
jgi:hypothetical protein